MSVAAKRLLGLGELAAVLVGAAILAAVAIRVIDAVNWPAYNSSNVTTALTTTGQCVALAVLLVAVLLARSAGTWGSRGWLRTTLVAIGISGFATVTLAMPLGATKLYLFGISVDQQFRTEYLTRLTDSPALHDMTYAGLPPYYPAGWFWLGGRYANLTGDPAWAAYKPWSIISIAAAAALAAVLWQRLVRSDHAIALGLATTVAALMWASPEPYGAVLVLLGPPLLVLLNRGLRDGSRWALAGGALFIGFSATCYTLYTALYAGTAILLALYHAVQGWRDNHNLALDTRAAQRRAAVKPLARLVIAGAISLVIALLVWGPYLLERLRNEPASGGTASHYLPARGAVLPFPFLHWTLMGALTFVGVVWLLLRFRRNQVALTLAAATVGVYLICLLSMIATAGGTTLLSFRLEPVLIVVLAAAGVLGFAELASAAVDRLGDVRLVIAALATAAAIAVGQGIPGFLGTEISIAYTDTDGDGVRADQRPPGAEAYYPQLHTLIAQQTGKADHDLVVLTSDYGFLALYPYYGFQGLTSHYANPLAQFDKRAAAIDEWSQSTNAADLIFKMAQSPWRAPDVFVFRYATEGYDLRLAEDVYPNDPNVKRYNVTFSPTLFKNAAFTVTSVGPFVVVVRKAVPLYWEHKSTN